MNFRSIFHLPHALRSILVIGAVGFLLSGCGVRAFNAKIKTPKTNFTGNEVMVGHGPFYASSQDGHALVTEQCKTQSGRQCLKASVVAGMPWQYDTNSHLGSSPWGQSPVNPYSTKSGAGKTKVATGPRAPGLPAVENRDLFLLGQ